jgi:hypothetical protein
MFLQFISRQMPLYFFRGEKARKHEYRAIKKPAAAYISRNVKRQQAIPVFSPPKEKEGHGGRQTNTPRQAAAEQVSRRP